MMRNYFDGLSAAETMEAIVRLRHEMSAMKLNQRGYLDGRKRRSYYTGTDARMEREQESLQQIIDLLTKLNDEYQKQQL